MRRRTPAPPARLQTPAGPLTAAEEQQVRGLLGSRPSSTDLAELEAIAGAERVVPGYLMPAKHYDAQRVTEAALHELLRTRYADPWDYWRAL